MSQSSILDALQRAREPLSAKDLAKTANLATSSVLASLRALKKQGRIATVRGSARSSIRGRSLKYSLPLYFAVPTCLSTHLPPRDVRNSRNVLKCKERPEASQ